MKKFLAVLALVVASPAVGMTLKPHQTTVWIDYEAMKGADRLIHAGALREREQALGLRSSRLGGFRIGATMELGRSMMSAGAGAARATGSSTTDRKICSINSGGAYSRSRSRCGGAALNDHKKLAGLTLSLIHI